MRVRLGGVAVDVLTETVIDRPCAEVAAYAADPSHAPRWYVNIASVQWLTPPPVRVGSRLAFVAQFLGAGSPTPTRSSTWCPGSGW
jgi:hypothetical protein